VQLYTYHKLLAHWTKLASWKKFNRLGSLLKDGPVFRNAAHHKELAEINPFILRPEDKPEPKHSAAILLGHHLLAELALKKLQDLKVPVHFHTIVQLVE
jgi:hypothetical protein